jgi:hypothetical protein
MDIGAVMDQVAARLATIADLRTYAYPRSAITPPAAVVSYPETVTFDVTYGRGMDQLTLPIVLAVGKPTERATRDQAAAFADGAGAESIKQVLESGTYTAFDDVRVSSVDFDVVTIGGVAYLAAIFTAEIAGPGSS